MFLSRNSLSVLGFGLIGGLSMATIQGCDDGPLGNLLEQCGLTCNDSAFIEGKASISGIAEVDAFFGAALDLSASLKGVASGLRAELDGIAVSVGLEPGASGADIAAGIDTYLSGKVEGGLTIKFDPPKCEAKVEIVASAAAQCDVEVDPGSVEFECSGSCEAEAGVAVDCGAEAELKCTGTAPNLECSGECKGTCSTELTAAAACEGTCKGTCNGTCSLTNAQGDCEGSCDGTCQGTCDVKLEASASCSGKCEGECTYTPPDGMCEASASAKCEAMGDAKVQCSGKCEGSAEAPSVSAECEASVEAKADASIECTPPQLAVDFQLSAALEGDANARAEFNAWLEGFKGRIAAMAAIRAKGDIVVDAAGKLAASGEGAIDALFGELSGSADLKVQVGGACAVANLPAALSAIGSAAGEASGEITASVSVFGAIGG
jgi:hypothetical protein